MGKIWLLCFLFAVCSVFAGPPLRPGVNTDAELSAKLIGTWMREEPGSSCDKTFTPDGTATGFIRDYDAEGNPALRVEFRSFWRVENGHLIGEVIESSDPNTLAVGMKFSDTIVYISDERFVFLEGEHIVVRVKRPGPTAGPNG